MGTVGGLARRVKKFLSLHPLWCIWFSRVKAIFHGLRAMRFRITKSFGCYVDSTVKITGWSKVHIGWNSVVAAGSWLNVNARDGLGPTLVIGENCFIGRNNFITVGKRVVLGDYCLTATNCSFIGNGHNFDRPNMPYISTGVDADAEIRIGANCFFGYGAMVIGSVSIGYGSVIAAGAVVLKNVPPLSVVIGNPGRVVKRYSLNKNCWMPVAEYVEEALLSEEEYVANMRRDIGYYPLPISAARSTLGDV
jgi:carbonic anhydrase/acetyltransferase-like protein (isoleucine patch superfamily)